MGTLRLHRKPQSAESDALAELQTAAAEIQASFMKCAQALARIRDGDMYRGAGYGTFEEYCQQRLGWSDRHGRRQIAAAEVIGIIERTGTGPFGPLTVVPVSESQVRSLTPHRNQPKVVEAAWKEAGDTAGGKQPTARQVEEAVEKTAPRRRLSRPAPKPPSKTDKLAQVRHLLEENPNASAQGLADDDDLELADVLAVRKELEAEQAEAAGRRRDEARGHRSDKGQEQPAWKRLRDAGGPAPIVSSAPWSAWSPESDDGDGGDDDRDEEESDEREPCSRCGGSGWIVVKWLVTHLWRGVSHPVEELAEGCPSVRMLGVSREPRELASPGRKEGAALRVRSM